MDNNIGKSIGIYCLAHKKCECTPLEVHINMWSIKQKKRSRKFYALDFGIMFDLNIKSIKIVLPFRIEDYSKQVRDLGESLADNYNLLCSVFNESYKVEKNPGGLLNTIKNENNENLFAVYKLNLNGSLKVETDIVNSNYTELTIDPQTSPEKFKQLGLKKIYVRFQIEMPSLEPFDTSMKVSNDFIQSAFTTSHLYDIRINDTRAINQDVVESIKKTYSPATFIKLHFFYMSEVTETVDNGSRLHLDTRMLEKKLWSPYFSRDNILEGHHLAYHWKKKEKDITFEKIQQGCFLSDSKYKTVEKPKPFTSFMLFFKTTALDVQRWRLFKYSCYVVLLGIIASFFVTLCSAFLVSFTKLQVIGLSVMTAICCIVAALIISKCIG